MGATTPLTSSRISTIVEASNSDADIVALQLYDYGTVRSSADICSANSLSIAEDAIFLSLSDSRRTVDIEVSQLAGDIARVAMTATLPDSTFNSVSNLQV